MRVIRKAIIPVAGLGTRLLPISSAVPKALLPLVLADGRVRPVVHLICAESAAAGVEQIALVVMPGQEELFGRYFAAARQAGDRDVPARIECVPAEPKGFGFAVAQGRRFVGREPFLVLLGDHVHLAEPGRPCCAAQVAAAFARRGGAAMIGMQTVGPDQLHLVGAARGQDLGEGVYRCTDFVEKPTVQTARRTLRTAGLADDEFLAHCGIYAFSAEIFDCLAAVAADLPNGKELQLADAQSLLLKRHPDDYYLLRVAGRALDTGTPQCYAQTLKALAGWR